MGRKETLEQRRHKRYKAKEGAFAVIRKQAKTKTLGQILDISDGGLAFKYIANGKPANSDHTLDIFYAGLGIQLRSLTFLTISDFPMEDQPTFSSIRMRRCGIQFTGLGEEHKSQIIEFINYYTLQ